MQPENQNQDGNWAYHPEEQTTAPAPEQAVPLVQHNNGVSWTGSEFIAHHKDGSWYSAAILGFVVLTGAVYLLTKDLISIITIAVVFVLFLILSGRKPEQQSYKVDSQGITIGAKFYPYNLFKSFAVSHEGAIGTVTFMPLGRLVPELSVYYAPEDEDQILAVLGESLPNEQRVEKATDRLMKRLRF